MKYYSADATLLTKYASGAVVGCSLLLSSCGDSDLPALQRDAIVAAQQRIIAQQAIEDAAQSTEEQTPAETPTETADEIAEEPDTAESATPEIGAATPDETGEQNSLDLDGFQIVFNENFDSGEIDPEKWNTSLPWGPDITVNNEEQYYIDSQNDPDFAFNTFRIDIDSIAISAQPTPADLLSAANNQPFLSGVLTTAGKFSFTEGIAEIRAKIPAGTGLWPQFWMLPEEFTGLRPQIFVMEARGDNPSEVFHSYKYQDENDNVQTTGVLRSTGEDLSADFHTYAVQWSENQLIFYIDGLEFQRIDNENIASQDMYLILNLAVGGIFPGSPDETTTFPAEFVIDHVRVFQRIQ